MPFRVALIGNIANNAFNMTRILRAAGVDAWLIDSGADRYPLSQPEWELARCSLPFAELDAASASRGPWLSTEPLEGVVDAKRRLGLSAQLETLGLGHPGALHRIFRAASRSVQRLLDERAPALAQRLDEARRVIRPGHDWPPAARRFLDSVRREHSASIEALARFDVVVAFGLHAAACAYLAQRPTLYFTYGGDVRVVLADPDRRHPELAEALHRMLHDAHVVIEAYGCDQEIHGVLQRHGLLFKTAAAFLPNVNLDLFSRPWDRLKAREKLAWPAEELVFLMPSRVDYCWKGSQRFFDAFAEVAAKHRDLRLVVTGWGADYKDAQARLAAVQERVTLLDRCYSKPELFDLYAAADVVVDQFAVGSLGSVSYEALCMGKPVLTYLAPFNLASYPTPPPLLHACTERDIRAQIERCIEDRQAIVEVGAEARQWYRAVYAADNLLDAIERVCSSAPQRFVGAAGPRYGDVTARPVPVPDSGATVRVDPWPDDCRGGLAIANDCEYTSWADLCRIYRWLGTDPDDAMGEPLALPVSASFWFYSEAPERLGPAYFEGTDRGRRSRLAPLLAELVSLGIIDTLHTYGGFDEAGGFRRDLAAAAVDEAARLGLCLPVWTNHGNPNNHQNVRGLWGPQWAGGDVPASRWYHFDLARELGTRYFWLDSYATNRFSLGTAGGERLTTRLAEPHPSRWGDRILCRDQSCSGEELVTFRRFRGKRCWAPDGDTIGDQLDSAHLDHLEASGGGTVIYQHLGCTRDDSGQPRSRAGAPLPPRSVAGLRELARRYHAGRLWVAPLGRWLRYVETVSQLVIEPTVRGAGTALLLSARRGNLQEADLAAVQLRLTPACDVVAVQIRSDDRAVTACRAYETLQRDGETLVRWPAPEAARFPFVGDELG